MRLHRRILTRPMVGEIAGATAASYLRGVYALGRWTHIGGEAVDGFAVRGEPFIACLWHGRIAMMPFAWRRRGSMTALVSGHRDGRLLTGVLSRLGVDNVFGSASKHGAAALRQLLRLLRRGECVAITPDGPRGPRMRAHPGIVTLAKLSGVPIVPVTFSFSRCHVLDSWDRFVVPLPFGRGVFLSGAPIHVPRDADEATLEQFRQMVEHETTALTQRADAMTGFPHIEPEGPPLTKVQAAEAGP